MALNTSSKFIYFGPTLARGQLVKNTIFRAADCIHIFLMFLQDTR